MTGHDAVRQQLAEALALALTRRGYGLVGSDAAIVVALVEDPDVTTAVEAIAARRAADEVRDFYLHAADKATRLGRRGPNTIADWLLDIGHAHAADLRARAARLTTNPQEQQ